MAIFEITKNGIWSKNFREIDLFDFTSFLAWIFLIFWPTDPGIPLDPRWVPYKGSYDHHLDSRGSFVWAFFCLYRLVQPWCAPRSKKWHTLNKWFFLDSSWLYRFLFQWKMSEQCRILRTCLLDHAAMRVTVWLYMTSSTQYI